MLDLTNTKHQPHYPWFSPIRRACSLRNSEM